MSISATIAPIAEKLGIDRFDLAKLIRKSKRDSRLSSVGGPLLLGGILVSSAYLAYRLINRATANRHQQKRTEHVRDKTLKDSFPASDPPASQYFDIPVNRQ